MNLNCLGTHVTDDSEIILPAGQHADIPLFEAPFRMEKAENTGHTLSVNYSSAFIKDRVHTVVELHPLDLRSEDGQDVPPGPALRTVVVIDGSTSMAEPHGPGNLVSKLDKIKMFCRLLIQTATEDDHIGIVTFGTHAKVIFPLTEMDSENKEKAMNTIEDIESNGVTNISDGLIKALEQFRCTLFRRNKKFNDNIVLFTDGNANEGELDVDELISHIRMRVNNIRDDSLYEEDYRVRICTCGTRGFMSEFLYILGRTFSSDPLYLISDDSSIELNLIKPVLLRRAEIASHIQVKITALNGVTFDKEEMPQHFTSGLLPEENDWTDPLTARFWILDITAEIPRNLRLVLKLPNKSKRAMKNKNVLNIEIIYKGRDRKERKLECLVPYERIPRKESKNTDADLLEVAKHESRLFAMKSLVDSSECMRRLDRSAARDALHDGANTIRDFGDQLQAKLSEDSYGILVHYTEPILINFQYFDHHLGDFTLRWDDAWGMLMSLVSSLSRESPTTPEVYVGGTEMYVSNELDDFLDVLYAALEDMYKENELPEEGIGFYKSSIPLDLPEDNAGEDENLKEGGEEEEAEGESTSQLLVNSRKSPQSTPSSKISSEQHHSSILSKYSMESKVNGVIGN